MTELDDDTEEWLNCDNADEDNGEEYVSFFLMNYALPTLLGLRISIKKYIIPI